MLFEKMLRTMKLDCLSIFVSDPRRNVATTSTIHGTFLKIIFYNKCANKVD